MFSWHNQSLKNIFATNLITFITYNQQPIIYLEMKQKGRTRGSDRTSYFNFINGKIKQPI